MITFDKYYRWSLSSILTVVRFDLFSQMHRKYELSAENASSVGRYELTRDGNAEFFSRSKLRHVLLWGRGEEGPLFDLTLYLTYTTRIGTEAESSARASILLLLCYDTKASCTNLGLQLD